MTTEVKQPIDLNARIAKLAETIKGGDTNAVLAGIGEIAKAKGEIAKAQAEAMRKEAEALSGDRAKLAEQLTNRILKQMPNIGDLLGKVKKFILAGDMDGPGAILREELARAGFKPAAEAATPHPRAASRLGRAWRAVRSLRPAGRAA